MAIEAVELTALQKNAGAIARALNVGERDNAVQRDEKVSEFGHKNVMNVANNTPSPSESLWLSPPSPLGGEG